MFGLERHYFINGLIKLGLMYLIRLNKFISTKSMRKMHLPHEHIVQSILQYLTTVNMNWLGQAIKEGKEFLLTHQ